MKIRNDVNVKKIIVCFINFIPINKKLILFESVDFGDNSKALFDRMVARQIAEKYTIIWLVRDVEQYRKVYPEMKFASYGGIAYRFWYRFFAAYCFFSHNLTGIRSRKGQIRCFLTHGLSFKDTKNFYRGMDFCTDIISTSGFAAQLRCRTFQGVKDSIRILGYPRTDLFFKKNGCRKKLGIPEHSKLIVWMPTFKHYIGGTRNDGGGGGVDALGFLSEDDFTYLNKYLEEKDSFLMIKFHPNQDMNFVNRVSRSNIGTYVNHDLRECGVDVYEVLAESNALITDFSSVYTDYLLCDKPIGFDISGMENYKLGFSVDNPLEYMPGKKISRLKELLEFIDIVVSGNDPFYKERMALKEKMHKYSDGRSADRIIDYFHL